MAKKISPKFDYLAAAFVIIISDENTDAELSEFKPRSRVLMNEYIRQLLPIKIEIKEVDLLRDYFVQCGYILTYVDDYAPTYYSLDEKQITSAVISFGNDPSTLIGKFNALRFEWLEKALENIEDSFQNDPDELTEAIFVPATDRLVSRSHNQEQFSQATQDLEKIVLEVRGNNNFAEEEPEVREAVLADLAAGQKILKSGHFWLRSLCETLIKALKYVAKKFGDSAIGVAAKELLKLLLAALGLG